MAKQTYQGPKQSVSAKKQAVYDEYLAELMATEKLTSPQVARLIGIDNSTLGQWRKDGRGPRFSQGPGEHARYLKSDVLAYLAAVQKGGDQ